MTRMRVLIAASEAYPLMKTGGLGDVAGALPPALRALGIDARLVLPAYPRALDAVSGLRTVAHSALYGGAVTLYAGRVPDAHAPDGDLPVYLIGTAGFAREGNPYQDDAGRDWPDNPGRYALYCRACAALALGHLSSDWRADLVHAHDWQAALLPALLALETERPKTVFTIHNLAYQGLVSAYEADRLGFPAAWWSHEALEFHGQLALIKAGIVYADRVTTVSPRYASEIQTPEFGCGLDGLLHHRASVLSGILNGIDPALWDPSTDPALVARYDADRLDSKQRNKAALQTELGLDTSPRALLLGMVSRLVAQKGVDLLIEALPALLREDVQLVVLGSGDAALVQALRLAAASAPRRIVFRAGYDEPLAHRIQGGADALLVPSRFEPCGLTQLYALRYGTVPIVHAVGGLADTVVDADAQALADARANGISFGQANVASLLDAVRRAAGLYRAGAPWRQMQRTGMARDHSWTASAAAYRDLYTRVLAAGTA